MKSVYSEDLDDDSEFLMPIDEDDESNANLTVSDALSVEKILGRKYVKDENGEMDELYFIKWKKMSYLHASWERRSDIERVDLQAKQKIKRFLLTPQPPGIVEHLNAEDVPIAVDEDGEPLEVRDEGEEIDYFNPEMVEVQRVIACDTPSVSHSTAKTALELLKGKNSGKKRKHASSASLASQSGGGGADIDEDAVKYLIKWRGLSYDECSWERWDEIKATNYNEVFAFWQLQRSCPKLPIRPKKFPSLQEYAKLDTSPIFGKVSPSSSASDGKSSGSSKTGSTETLPAVSSSVSLAEMSESGGAASGDGDNTSSPDEEPASAGLTLRDYQLEGVNWLLWNWWHKRPCILADEMGLGKTIQTIGFLHQLRHMRTTRVSGPFLIVAPLSLVDQWQSEIAVWSPDMNTVLLHGNAEAREAIIEHEFYFKEPYVPKQDASMLKRSGVCKFNILLTTFEVAIKDIRILSKINWQVLIVDEAHKLKNQQSRLFTNLSAIPHEHCILLTGTPLQNKTEELWALLNFTDPTRFGDLNDFVSKFGDLKDSSQVARLHDVLKPYLLRRIKEDVEKSLPPKEETIVEVALTAVQKRYYKAIYEKNTMYLYKGLRPSNQPSLMNVMMELRKCCNHPYLVKGVEERIIAEINPAANVDGTIDAVEGGENSREGAAEGASAGAMDVTVSGGGENGTSDTNGSVSSPGPALPVAISQEVLHRKLIESSGKLVLLDKLLPRLFAQGHKVLIFSQMVRVLNLLEDFLRYKGYSYERLDGGTKCQERKEAVERFCKPSMQKFIMLLSTKAGGLGLNLTAADTVIIFDSDWNPQNDLQAQARAHRIGQTKAVMVYRLLTRKTYEMEMFHQASMKLGLDRAVLAHARTEAEEEQSGNTSSAALGSAGKKAKNSNFTAKEIDELLKRGAYDVFREDDTEQNEFVEADIESILQRRAHKVVYDNNGGAVSSSLGSFSKASFVSSDETEAVDINDPDFWKKAVGLTEVAAPDYLDEELIVNSQRVRKQTQLYGEQPMNEAEIKEILRPIKAGGDKAKPSMTKAQREAAAKERAEREEAKAAKLAAENQAKNDPMTWGPHGRDRVLRALNMFGFGRWEKIKQESGHAGRETKGVESFSRAYILECGLCASDSEISKNDSDFVKDAINAAKTVDALVRSGQRTLEVPPCLTEEKFLAKLRSGLAKKSLNKLDVLTKLVNMMQKVVEEVYKSRGLVMDPSVDLDALLSELTLEEVCAHIPLGDVRPSWTRIREWWDLECDKHMLIGIYRHGYGRYDLIKDDTTLVFHDHLQREWNELNAANASSTGAAGEGGGVGGENGESSGAAPMEGVTDSAAPVTSSQEGGAGDISLLTSSMTKPAAAPSSAVKASASKVTLSAEDSAINGEGDNADDMNEGGAGGDDDGEGFTGAAGAGKEAGPVMPDARSLNRLFCWLVSSDAAKMTKSQMAEKQKLIRKSKAAEAQEKREQAKIKAEAAEQEEDLLLDLSRGKSAGDEAEHLFGEMALLCQVNDLLDVEAVSVAHKAQIQGLKKTEAMFALPIYGHSAPTSPTAASAANRESSGLTSQSLADRDNNASSASVNNEMKSEVSEQVESLADNVDSASTNDNVSVVLPEKQQQVAPSSPRHNHQHFNPLLPHSLTEFEAVRLSCYFILFGAPIDCHATFGPEKAYSLLSPGAARSSGMLSSSLLYQMGLESSSVAALGLDKGYVSLHSWSDVQQRCGIHQSPETLEQFYRGVWLPFCYAITKRKALSHSQHKFIVPNPKMPPSDHHYAARGLCHVALLRQQLLYAAYHVLVNDAALLLDYLKSSQGRNVDNMPVWWCPWIHDLGVLIGLVKHGFLSLKELKADEELPFTFQHIEMHVRQVFLYGCSSVLPAGLDELPTLAEAEYFVQVAVLQFPDLKDLEFRVMRILEDVTRGLPSDHPCRVRSYQALRGMSFAASSSSSATQGGGGAGGSDDVNRDEDGEELVLLPPAGSSGRGRGGKDAAAGANGGAAVALPLSRGGRTVAKYPAMPLKRFQRETAKRRKVCISVSHPDLFRSTGGTCNGNGSGVTAVAEAVAVVEASAGGFRASLDSPRALLQSESMSGAAVTVGGAGDVLMEEC